ncbi:hypothetical protein [Ornithinimicrobium cryptoxanthini]|uniref:Copper(I)-binding protein n=1 Tax=Ornithinimicrobium cryptoxanthini TaxID=2934161 RepID=A0ABY4YIW9_9MICO|nr:hypothetical protein [Ornithinimicrobium cryptoxanthini]USQ76455.1 hypothetical protein NF557_00535 [Ornithinimicrobium cryptoxanthini]
MTLTVPPQAAHTSPARRRGMAWAAVAVGVALLAVLSLWGQMSGTGRALVGSEVPHDGGSFVVTEAWTTVDPMMLMHPDDADNFAALGMQMGAMSAMLPDAIPGGSKRVAIELAMSAGGEEMTFPAGQTSLTADGVSYGPYLALLGDESLPPGTRINAVVIFEVPMDTGAAQFRLGPDSDQVHVDVGAGGGGGHQH